MSVAKAKIRRQQVHLRRFALEVKERPVSKPWPERSRRGLSGVEGPTVSTFYHFVQNRYIYKVALNPNLSTFKI